MSARIFSPEDIERLLASSPGATADSLALGFETRAARLREIVAGSKSVCFPVDMELARLDDVRAAELRAYAREQACEVLDLELAGGVL